MSYLFTVCIIVEEG